MRFKGFILFIVIVLILYLSGGFYLLYSNSFPEIPNKELIIKSPIYLWELIKNWVVSI